MPDLLIVNVKLLLLLHTFVSSANDTHSYWVNTGCWKMHHVNVLYHYVLWLKLVGLVKEWIVSHLFSRYQ